MATTRPRSLALLNVLLSVLFVAGCGGQPTPQSQASVTAGGPNLEAAQAPAPSSCHYVANTDPDPACTPGAAAAAVTQENVETTICVAGYSSHVRPPVSYTGPLKKAILQAYGDSAPADAYELDHLVSLELGGDPRSAKNLWPEPWERDAGHPDGIAPPGTGAQTKDRLENELHRRVCAGPGSPTHMRLEQAQSLIAADWHRLAVSYGYAA